MPGMRSYIYYEFTDKIAAASGMLEGSDAPHVTSAALRTSDINPRQRSQKKAGTSMVQKCVDSIMQQCMMQACLVACTVTEECRRNVAYRSLSCLQLQFPK